MALPAIAMAAGGLASAIGGLFGNRKRNKRIAQQYAEQQRLTGKQTDQADYIQQLVQQLMAQNPGMQDPYGGGTTYDPVTGRWRTTVDNTSTAIQGASDQEEIARNTIDQFLRRSGLQDSERLRQGASQEADAERAALAAARAGVNRVNPDQVAGQLRVDRTSAVNAGYDDVLRGVTRSISRTGADGSKILTALARNRSNDIARTMGSPVLEGIQFADAINQGRDAIDMNQFNTFQQQGRSFYDAGFVPSDRFDKAYDRAMQLRELDLRRQGLGMEGAATGAAIVGNAARGLREAGNTRIAATNWNPFGQFANQLGSLIGGLRK